MLLESLNHGEYTKKKKKDKRTKLWEELTTEKWQKTRGEPGKQLWKTPQHLQKCTTTGGAHSTIVGVYEVLIFY